MRWKLCLLAGFISLNRVWGQMKYLNIYGIETELMDCQCSFKNPCEYYMDLSVSYGFNGFRIPFSAEYVHRGNWEALDRVINKATQLNTPIIIDYHRTYASHQGNWYETTMKDFLEVWEQVLYRYYDKPIVRYVDLYNEFQDGNDKAQFWSDTMTEAIQHLEQLFPHRYNWVVGGTNWGGNLHNVKINLPYDNIYYTIHKYQFSLSGDDYRKDYDFSFGFVPPDRLIVGEYGWITERPDQVQWAHMFLAYLKEKGFQNTAFWTLALSGDTDGILRNDCITLDNEKLNILRQFWDNNHAFRDRSLFSQTNSSLWHIDRSHRRFNDTWIDSDDDVVMEAIHMKYAPYYYGDGPCHLRRHP